MWESRVLLINIVLDKLGLQINTIVLKEKDILASLPDLMVELGHNVSKFNSQVLTVTRLLRRNRSSAPELLCQLFPAYLACLDVVLHAYITLKQNRFEEGME